MPGDPSQLFSHMNIRHVFIQIHPDKQLAKNASEVMTDILEHILNKIASKAEAKDVITQDRIHSATAYVITGSFGKGAIAAGQKAVKTFKGYESSKYPFKGPTKTNSTHLRLPVVRVADRVKAITGAARIEETAAVYLTSVLEYMVGEILDVGYKAWDNYSRIPTVTAEHIITCLLKKKSLNALMKQIGYNIAKEK